MYCYASDKKCIVSASKCTKNCLATELSPDLLGELRMVSWLIPWLDLEGEKEGKRREEG